LEKAEYLNQLRLSGEWTADLHKRAIIDFATHIRMMDEERELSRQLGVPSMVTDEHYCGWNAAYRILNFGSDEQILTLLFGNEDKVAALINPIVKARRFTMPTNIWMELA
jgi:hypothetical protein